MFKKLLLTTAFSLVLLPVGGAANAADLGGDCCADLEERVATLEATTARKGNRKVSLTISGYVSQQLWLWDDGDESDVYVADNLNDLGSRINFSGNAKINSEWSSGYHINLGFGVDNAFADQTNDDNGGGGVFVDQAFLWVKSEKLGKVSWGLQSQASDNRSLIPGMQTGTLLQTTGHVIFDTGGLLLRPKGGANGVAGRSATPLGAFGSCVGTRGIFGGECSGDRTNSVRYDTPTIAGFTLSASWGEDDFWDVAFSYVNTWGDFKVAASGSYSENSDEDRFNGAFGSADADASYAHVGGTLFHNPTGLFVYGSYGHEDADVAGAPDSDHWYVQAGIKTKLNSLGSTTFYGEYGQYLDMYGALFRTGDGSLCGAFNGITGTALDAACANAADNTVNITDSELTRFGLGVVQSIDAASMQVWLKWVHYELDVDFSDAGVAGKQEFEDVNSFMAGGVIFF
jgi:predicted porin